MVSCAEFDAGLNDLLDRRQPLELEGPLADHAAGCGECRALFAAYGGLARVVAMAPLPAPPPGLAGRVLRDYRSGKHQDVETAPQTVKSSSARSRSYGLAWRIAASAACLLLGLGLWQFGPALWGERSDLVAQPQRPDSADESASDPSEIGTQSGTDVNPARSSLAQQAADCYAELAVETGKDLSHVMALVPDLSGSTVARVLPPADGTSEVAQDVASGLRPLADSTSGAVSFLMDVLPGGQEL